MRDIALALALLVLVPMALRHPWIGIMTWAWVSLMSPQLQTYGFMLETPVAMAVGVATLLGALVTKDPRRMTLNPPVVMLIIFSLWMVITYFFSLVNTSENLGQLDKVLKINLMTLMAIYIISTRRQVDILIGVVVLSLAYFGVKGGIFTVLTGGGFRVRGEGGFIGGNNEVGLALIMTIPLIYYLILVTHKRMLRWGLWAVAILNVIAVFGTQSRGALLGILAMTAAFILRSPKPLRLFVPILSMAIFVLIFMPDSWWERMGSIDNYQEDQSAMGRINAWTLAFNVAKSNLFGGGFYLESADVFGRYAPNPDFIAVAHSIYFQVLGQHGFIGLLLYLGFWLSVLSTGWWVGRNAQTSDDLALARMIEISLVGFAAGGAFLNLAYFDGPYYLMVALVVVRYKLMENIPKSLTSQKPATTLVGGSRTS